MFGFLKKKKADPLTPQQQKWNKLWDMWVKDQVESPYRELMTYESEVNNGGHDQYFTNVENTGDLQGHMAAVETGLSPELAQNLRMAYQAYLTLEENDEDAQAEEVISRCDDVFYENEQQLLDTLKARAEKIRL